MEEYRNMRIRKERIKNNTWCRKNEAKKEGEMKETNKHKQIGDK